MAARLLAAARVGAAASATCRYIRGYVRTLKRKDAGQIRHLLQTMGKRLRVAGATAALRWSESSP